MLQGQFAPQMWAARPHLGSIFEKLLHRKTFSLPAALSLQPRLFYFDVVFHMKHFEIASRETTQIWFGKAGAHPQLALGIAIAPETLCSHCNLLILMAIAILCDSLLDFCLRFSIRFYLLRKCGLLAHTSAAFL